MQGVQAQGSPTAQVEEERRRLFQAVFEEFNATGNWPSLNRLERQLVKEMDVHDVVQGLGHPWLNVNSSNDPTLELRLPAIALCKGSEDVTSAFIRTLQLAVAKYLGAEPTPELTQQILVNDLGLSNLRAHQALVLYRNENLWSSIQGQVPGDWIIKIDRHVRPYRDVATLQDYVQRRYGQELTAFPLAGAKPAFRVHTKPEAVPLVFLSHSGAPEAVTAASKMLRECLGSSVQVWSDAELPGGRWDENIREKLSKTTAFVLLGTPSILGSVYVGFETGYVDARLGQRNVFLLRLGVQVNQLQNRPPLAHYQSFDGTSSDGLEDFCNKLAQELGASLQGTPDYVAQASALTKASKLEVERSSRSTIQGATPYEVAREDLSFWDRISRIACAPFGERGAIWVGRTLIVAGIISVVGVMAAGFLYQERLANSFLFPLGLYGGFGAGMLGFVSIRAAHHKQYRRCDECHADYALKEIGTPIARDLPLSDGGKGDLQRITERTYKCLKCNEPTTLTWKRTIRARV